MKTAYELFQDVVVSSVATDKAIDNFEDIFEIIDRVGAPHSFRRLYENKNLVQLNKFNEEFVAVLPWHTHRDGKLYQARTNRHLLALVDIDTQKFVNRVKFYFLPDGNYNWALCSTSITKIVEETTAPEPM